MAILGIHVSFRGGKSNIVLNRIPSPSSFQGAIPVEVLRLATEAGFRFRRFRIESGIDFGPSWDTRFDGLPYRLPNKHRTSGGKTFGFDLAKLPTRWAKKKSPVFPV